MTSVFEEDLLSFEFEWKQGLTDIVDRLQEWMGKVGRGPIVMQVTLCGLDDLGERELAS